MKPKNRVKVNTAAETEKVNKANRPFRPICCDR